MKTKEKKDFDLKGSSSHNVLFIITQMTLTDIGSAQNA